MNINIQGVNITLTKEQLEQIDNQVKKSKLKTIDDINSYEDGCEILQRQPDYRLQSINGKYFAEHVLETLIEAVNFIDNSYKKWIPDFTNNNEYKYIPYFNKIGSGWLLCAVHYFLSDASGSVGLYYKNERTANIISKKFLSTYNIYLG
jgi:hypothetical protein